MTKHYPDARPRYTSRPEIKLDPDKYPEFFTTEDFAEVVRNTPEGVRYWRHIGKGPRSFRVGRRVLYAREDVEQWLNEQMNEDKIA